MPELPEVEAYRLALAEILPAQVARASARHPYEARTGAAGLASLLERSCLADPRRHGKVLLLDLRTQGGSPPFVLALRFGMTGVLWVDGRSAIDGLYFGPRRVDPSWVRLDVELLGGHHFAVSDPRGLGRSELDPDLRAFGPDAKGISSHRLAERVRGRRAPLKAALLDQGVVAGLGNLLVDEALWRAGLPPQLPARALDADEVERLAYAIRACVDAAIAAGGSHRGRLVAARRPGGRCPLDGAELVRDRIANRSTWWCPLHQRRGGPAPRDGHGLA